VTVVAVGRELHPASRRILNAILLALVVGASLLWYLAYLEASKFGPDRPQQFNDANTYLAAIERLDAGHSLYALSEGDRPILTIPGVYEAPLLSPPPIAAIWRVVAAIPFGFQLWMVAAWVATFIAVGWVVLRAPLPGAPLALAVSLPLGEQIFGGNACCFYPLFYLLAWRYRDRAWIGILVAVMAAIKLAPIAVVAWLLGTRRYRAVGIAGATLVGLFVAGGLVAGFGSYGEYLAVIPGVGASPMSVSGMTGIPWASYAVFGLGIVAAIVLGRRSSGASYVVAVLAAILGTPALYPGHLASLLAVVAPLTDRRRKPGDSEPVASPTVPGVAAMEA
jgi:hypothetical protein